jgi:7-cyano-7-deazaguanine tRNA-ribosyltransferase
MKRDYFEVTHRDVLGRIGKLYTPHGKIQTPALMPVVNPNINFLEINELRKCGAEIVITNSYIIYRNNELRETVLKEGIHSLLKTDMPVMTDSGSYQLMVYGDVEIENLEILKFQKEIGSDIAVPLDLPTPPDADESLIKSDMEVTLDREREAAELFSGNENLIALPVQGSTNRMYRRIFAEKVKEIAESYDIRPVFPVGGVVPLLDTYRFSDVVTAILEAKSGLPICAPVHLFGAGHPMLFSIAVALGCDLFDSAAYALYAKDDRYMTVRGTEKIEEMNEFPCCCPVCLEYTPSELRKMDKKDRVPLIAKHNLYISFQEVRTVRQAIRDKTLFELVENRIRSHPYLLNAWRMLEKYLNLIDVFDAGIKSKFFYTGIESLMRPAVNRHEKKVLDIPPGKEVVVADFGSGIKADIYLRPCFGIVFSELIESYPAGHAEMPEDELIDGQAIERAVDIFVKYVKKYDSTIFRLKIGNTKAWRPLLKKVKNLRNVVVE